jgi:hypothetical protein
MRAQPRIPRQVWKRDHHSPFTIHHSGCIFICMPADFTDDELLAYADEALPAERMAVVEAELRRSENLRQRLIGLLGQRDQGVHSVGEVWRRARLTCLTRQQLGNYLLGVLDSEWTDYVVFHLQTVGCRFCNANLDDLKRTAITTPDTQQRRQKYFQSSVGGLHTRPDDGLSPGSKST